MKSIIKKGSKIYSIAHLKCPHCQEGNLFSVSNSYDLKHMLDMPDYCLVCQEDFKVEPGFYSGALWVSYPIVIFILVPLALLQILCFDFPFVLAFFISLVIMLVLQPLLMRYSRAIWINIFVSYNGNKS